MTTTPAKLTTFEIESLLTQLPGWTVVAGKLHREYRFPNFGKAFGFMKTAAPHFTEGRRSGDAARRDRQQTRMRFEDRRIGGLSG
jgi:pterin-4a-carbinolamine dehydratase